MINFNNRLNFKTLIEAQIYPVYDCMRHLYTEETRL